MPLAVELTSARVNVLSVAQIAERLDRRLDFLVSPARGDAQHRARHRTLRAAIDWSYDDPRSRTHLPPRWTQLLNE
jgi:predicted ATPase